MPTRNMIDTQYEIKVFRKAIEVLDSFTEAQPELRLMEIQRILNINKSSLYRILVNLEACGMVTQDTMTGMYRLGTRFLHYANVCLAGLTLVDIAKPYAKKLADETKESVVINVVQGDEAVCIEKIDSQQPLKLYVDLGRAMPLLVGASAKVLAAYLPMDRLKELYSRSNLDISFEELCAQLEHIRRTGVACTVGEHEANIVGVASPIRNSSGDVVAGIAILGPSIRIHDGRISEFARLCKQSADAISRELGGS